MGGDYGFVYIVNMFNKIFYFVTIFSRKTVAGRVRYVYYCCASLDNSLDNPCQVLVVSASSVFRIKFDILYILFSIFYGGYGAFYYFITIAVELLFNVRIAGSYSCMYAVVLGIFKRLGRNVDIFLYGARQRTDCWPGNGLGNFYYRIEIARAGYRKTGLDYVYSQLLKLFGHLYFLNCVKLTPGHLLAVPKCCVKNEKSVAHRSVRFIY